MSQSYDYNELIQAIVDGEGEDAVEIVEKAIKENVGVHDILEKGLVRGMKIVSDKYDAKEYFIPDLAAAAQAMQDTLEIITPLLKQAGGEKKGVIVLGVVKACSQEIGKNIVSATLSGAGFDVFDLGVNVSPKTFVDKAKEVNADIIAMGSPMMQTVKYFTEVDKLLKDENMRDRVKLLVGGASTNPKTVEATGVDAWGKDARDAVLKAEELIKQLRKYEGCVYL